jgi:hypothetical protein
MPRLRTLLPALLLLLALPVPARAQLGAVEAFARRVSDLSFYFSLSDVTGGPEVEGDAGDVRAFGVELLFEVAEVTRRIGPPTEPADSVERVWTGVEVVRSGEEVDTIYTYTVEEAPPPEPPTETVWTLELGLGYGQLQGYELEDPALDMNVSIRDLPSISLYANYEPWGNYFGLRTGFMRTQALQVATPAGETYSGDGEAFLFGGLTGYAFALEDLWFFLETGYTVRDFPSVEWSGPGALPPGIPRELDVSGWFLTSGVQFPIG